MPNSTECEKFRAQHTSTVTLLMKMLLSCRSTIEIKLYYKLVSKYSLFYMILAQSFLSLSSDKGWERHHYQYAEVDREKVNE